MKILHVYKDYFPVSGGIENHVKLLAEAQAARGHDVSALVTSLDRHTHVEQMRGVRVIFAARLARVSSTPLSRAMFQWLARERPDIAHLHFPYPWGEVGNYFWGHARKTVMTYHSDIVRQKYLRVAYAPLMWRVLARVDAIMPTSPMYAHTSPVLQKKEGKCIVVPLGIDTTRFLISPPCPFLSGGGEKGERLLFVGALRYYKGLPYLLQALAQIPHAHLVVVGSGPKEGEWHALAHSLGVAERVQFVGHISDEELPSYFAACDVFVLPSSERSEAYGIVQLEAMASGKPVVCTELGTGTSFVNVDGETGYVVPARDSQALAAAIHRLLDNAALRERMGAAGRARVLQEFTLEKMVDRVMDVYSRVVGSSNSQIVS